MAICEFCGAEVVSFGQHYRFYGQCRRAHENREQPAVEERPPKRSHTADGLFRSRLASRLRSLMWSAHFNDYMTEKHLSLLQTVVVSIVLLVLDFISSEVPESRAACNEVSRAMKELPSVRVVLAQAERKLLRVEPILFSHVGAAQKGGCFFSLIQLVTVMLQESAEVRRHTIAASDEWKTGALFMERPSVYRDVTCGSAFRSRSDICGRAAPAQSRDLRVVIHGWTDEFTSVDGLGVNAKHNKYGAVLGALVNLPLHLRHSFAFILLIALYRAKFAAQHGGLMRMLTGVSETGEAHQDGLTLAAEVRLGQEGGTEIELPSDVPGEDDVTWRLRVFLLLFSLDWLAQGDFGPFAASVSARRPCFKCLWTASCPCAYLPTADADGVEHTIHCRGRKSRTHASVMHVVHELRAWKGSATLMDKHKTDTGIFSPHFASEYLLYDIVRDSTVDIMHIFLCGVSRYLLSFLTDILIPGEFTWPVFTDACRKHPWKRGAKPPIPEPRAKGTGKRASKASKMTASEAMYFTLARHALKPRAARTMRVLTTRVLAAQRRHYRAPADEPCASGMDVLQEARGAFALRAAERGLRCDWARAGEQIGRRILRAVLCRPRVARRWLRETEDASLPRAQQCRGRIRPLAHLLVHALGSIPTGTEENFRGNELR